MFGLKSIKEQLMEERRKNARLEAQMAKVSADVEFIAMMSEIDIEQPELEESHEQI